MGHRIVRPNFSKKDLYHLLQQEYGVEGELTELPSERDQNLHLKATNGNEYILKIASPLEKKENL